MSSEAPQPIAYETIIAGINGCPPEQLGGILAAAVTRATREFFEERHTLLRFVEHAARAAVENHQ